MKYPKKLAKKVMLLAIAVAFVCVAVVGANAAVGDGANRFNVVFVVDCSGSMRYTDAVGFRYQAADLFLGLLTEAGGNQVGKVLFNDTVLTPNETMGASGTMRDKRAISDSIRSGPVGGDTDVGKALKAATELLDKHRDENLPSVIVLLTDGKTEGVDLIASNTAKQAAIQVCRNKDYKVFGVTLNQNGGADPAEIRDIVDATGGKFFEVRSAEDLLKTFEQFYTFIYNTDSISIAQGTGTIQGSFIVPKIGVDEVNIVIYSNAPLQSLRIKQPSGIWLSQNEIDAFRMDGTNFSVIKITNPMRGEWELEAICNPGDYAEIGLVPNLNVKVISVIPEQESRKLGDTIKISTKIYSHDKPVEDAEIYQSNAYGGYVKLTPANGGEEIQIPLSNGASAFTAELRLEQYGSFYATAVVAGEGLEYTGNTLSINVGNTPPEPVNRNETRTIALPLFKSKTDTLALGDIITDAEDKAEALTFEIVKSDFTETEITYNDADKTLSVTPATKGEYTVTIRATDTQGAMCEQTIKYTVTSLLLLILIILGILVFLLIAGLAFWLIWKATRDFGGSITVEPYSNENYYASETQAPGKGKHPLSRFSNCQGVDAQGFHGAKFVAKGNGVVMFESPRAFFKNGDTSKKVSKVELPRENEIEVSLSEDSENGLRIMFY
ncbi:MAG: VWA domain-containing protein [Oscillospiraceae bacterium]|nr:VWA domain-containing protein [Oscillospiraceae bacterium]